MKKIGEGWQYSVYELGNGRVLKKYNSWPRAAWIILKDIFPFTIDMPWKIPGFIFGLKEKAVESFEVLKRRNITPTWIGNPKFLDGFDFEQDKVSPLHEVFENSSTEEIKKIIDRFIEFNDRCFKLGFIDKSFNITKNYGIAKNGDLTLIDIGELFDDHDKIKRQLNDRVWNKSYVGGCIKDVEARKYFLSEMDKFAKVNP